MDKEPRRPDQEDAGPSGHMANTTDAFARAVEVARVSSVFGPAQTADGITIIPVATVFFAGGIGAGDALRESAGDGHEDSTHGAEIHGAGPSSNQRRGVAFAWSSPAAVIVVEGGLVRIRPVVQPAKIVLVASLLVAWNVYWVMRMLRERNVR